MFKGMLLVSLAVSGVSAAADLPPFDAAAAFGARPSVSRMRLSPDAKRVAYLGAIAGQGSTLYVSTLGADPRVSVAFSVDGKPMRLEKCDWVSDDRLVCEVFAVSTTASTGPFTATRIVAVNADGSNAKMLSTRQNSHSRGFLIGGGQVIGNLAARDGNLLMTRYHIPDDHIGSHLGSDNEGLGVDLIDSKTGTAKILEHPRRDAVTYLSDAEGAVRIMGSIARFGDDYVRAKPIYSYRAAHSSDWQRLCDLKQACAGFIPLAVDSDQNVVYGILKKEGRDAIYTVALDGTQSLSLIAARDDVDVNDLMRIGRRERVIGVSYVTEKRGAVYTDAAVEGMLKALAKALPGRAVDVVDSSADESVFLIFAHADTDPGAYYVFDRKAMKLNTFLVARGPLENVKLASVKTVTYPASDGVMIPGYLTLPPGVVDAKGLPAIVMPHGGPASRDEWGFDWLPQYFALRGYAVLQPNYRGSSGYGDAWFRDKGFKSWNVAIGDVVDAGRWLVKSGIADASKIAIVGWSYGGYAALQSAIVDPSLFKAVVAVAPVTDLPELVEEHRNWDDFLLVSDYVGSGPHTREGSPARHADQFKAPVLIFHGTLDANVSVLQSRLMADRLNGAHVKNELVIEEGLDHQLEDSAVRADLLRRSDSWLQQAFVH